MATATKSKETEHTSEDSGKASDATGKVIELSPTHVQAFQKLRGIGDVGTPIGTADLDTKTIRSLEAAGVLEVTDKRRQGKGYAPTQVKLLVAGVQGNPDLEPKTRTRRATAVPSAGRSTSSGATSDLPSVEEMQQLLAAIAHAEVAANDEVSKESKKKLDEAWAEFTKLKPGSAGFAEAYDRFNAADAGLKSSGSEARKNAFAAIRTDAKHVKVAKYLRLLTDRV